MKFNYPEMTRDWTAEWFPLGDVTYLNFAAHAAIPRVALDALQGSIAAKKRPHIVDDATFFALAASLRRSLATLIQASPDEIALMNGAGSGLSVIAYALKWSPGDEVLIARGEFPAHYATWKPLEKREGIKLNVVCPRDRFIDANDLIAAMTPRTRVISVSHVRFDDGSMLDVPRLAAACTRNGTLLVLDISQSCGAIPLDVRHFGADFMVCAGYKYLLSPWGTGFLWAKRSHLEQLLPGPYNWLSQGVETFARLNYVDPGPSPNMSRWDTAEASSLYNFNLTVMEASVRFVLNVGAALIHDHNQTLIRYLFERLPDGCRVASPLEANRRGVFGCIDVGNREETEALYQVLRGERFVVALREGRIRIAPHLLNTTQDMDRLLATLRTAPKGAGHVAN
jgi:selenocysteine lyase/cysteine desulfurase